MQETKDAQAGAPRTQNVPEQGSVAVLIPCYNEAVTIGKVVDDFHRVLPDATVYRAPRTCPSRAAWPCSSPATTRP